MKQGDKDRLREYYGSRLKVYGHDTRSLGWTPGGRKVRFGVLTSIGDLDNCSLLDVGCGFGDLHGYLAGREINVDYTGIDLNPEFIRIAKDTYPDASFAVADFEDGAIENSYDWIFAAGIFTIRLDDNPSFIRSTLSKMFELSSRGFAADFLSPVSGDGAGDTYWRCQPDEILRLCRGLSRRVVLRADYMAGEFCIYVYKNDMADERNVFEGFEGP